VQSSLESTGKQHTHPLKQGWLRNWIRIRAWIANELSKRIRFRIQTQVLKLHSCFEKGYFLHFSSFYREMLNPDPHKISADPQPCCKEEIQYIFSVPVVRSLWSLLDNFDHKNKLIIDQN
jgi:hypothetical protein